MSHCPSQSARRKCDRYIVEASTPISEYRYMQTLLIPRKVYQLILGINQDPPLYKTSAGLLVRDDLHHAYDRLEWSLYYKVSSNRGRATSMLD